jgi:hypothetical protein
MPRGYSHSAPLACEREYLREWGTVEKRNADVNETAAKPALDAGFNFKSVNE